MKPLILLNFKTYPEAAGKKALLLAKKLEKVHSSKFEIVIAPSLPTLEEVAARTSLPVFSQHTDLAGLGPFTGKISAQELKKIGVKGTLLNHSERKIPFSILKKIVADGKKHKLVIVICASSLKEAKKVAALAPDYLAYEPPELIGGNVSVTKAKPEVIAKAVEIVKKISPKTKVLCGAGIQSGEDIRKALELGAQGVLIGHAVPKAKDPARFLKELLA
ncbi:MAG TPA: triose-phosphate isomerase [Candidatus Nanoarchaeia archaeon]|nr:triose-phosphate isomerase [Candidatus Nanoarchaeia archaeon]